MWSLQSGWPSSGPGEPVEKALGCLVTCRSGKDVEIDRVDNPGFQGEGLEGVGPSAVVSVTARGGGGLVLIRSKNNLGLGFEVLEILRFFPGSL